jgi:crotonobetainyl-CoA:carnitine CoA-transferase CaiB-like acyl-CoA transferase
MVPRFDIVIENFRPGVMARFGLDYATLSALNPRLIYCSISGYGQSGPKAHYPAYAPVIHAASGFDLVNLAYQDGAPRPATSGIFIADVLGGTHAFGAIQAALYQREKTGQGQHIDVSMLEAMVGMLVYETQAAQFPGDPRRPLYTPLRTSDGFIMVAPTSPRNFEQLSEAVGHPEWQQDRVSAPMPTATELGHIAGAGGRMDLHLTGTQAEAILSAMACPARSIAVWKRCWTTRNWPHAKPLRHSRWRGQLSRHQSALPHERLAHPCARSCLAAGRRWRGLLIRNWVCPTKHWRAQASGDLL